MPVCTRGLDLHRLALLQREAVRWSTVAFVSACLGLTYGALGDFRGKRFFLFFPPPPDLLGKQRVDDFENHPAKLNGNLCSGRVAECQFRTLSALGELDGFSEKVLRSGLSSLVFLCFL